MRTSSSPSYFYVSIERRPWSEEQPVFRFLPVPTLSILYHRSIDADAVFWMSRGGDTDSPLIGRPVLVAIARRRLNGTPPRHRDGTIGKDDGQHTPTPMID
jgi:hypothetical protein